MLSLLLIAALSQTPSPQPGLSAPSARGAVVDAARWTTPTAADCADRAGDLLTQRGRVITLSRNATQLCIQSATATPCYVSANKPCITSAGLEIWGAAQGSNAIPYSSDGRSWTQRAGNPITVTYSATGGPAGGPYTRLVNVGAATTADLRLSDTGMTNNGFVATQVYVRKVSASGTLAISNSQSAALGAWAVDLAGLGAGWERITATHPAVTVTAPFKASAAGAAGMLFAAAADTVDFEFALATQQDGAMLGPPAETAGTPYAAPPTLVSFANPLAGRTDGTVAITATPADGWQVLAAGYAFDTSGASGRWRAFRDSSGGAFFLQMWDAAEANNFVFANFGAGADERTYSFSRAGCALRVTRAGAPLSATPGGTCGTPAPQGATFYVGNPAGSSMLVGHYKQAVLCRKLEGCR